MQNRLQQQIAKLPVRFPSVLLIFRRHLRELPVDQRIDSVPFLVKLLDSLQNFPAGAGPALLQLIHAEAVRHALQDQPPQP
ncbi:hypothetical protein D3C71_1580110 [compost metagenome]